MRARPCALLVLLLAAPAWAAPVKHAFTVDDMWAVKRVGAKTLSPDGRLVAYTVSTYDADENRMAGDIWLLAATGGAARRLTAHKSTESQPTWSPDGKRLAFVAKRDNDTNPQIYLMPTDGGEAERVTELPLGASDPRFLPGPGHRIAFIAPVIAGAESPEATRKAVEARDKNKVKARVTENRQYRYWDHWLTDNEYPHIFVLDLETRELRDLLPGSKRLFDLDDTSGSFAVSPDGQTIVFQANSTPEPYASLNADLYEVKTSGGEVRDLTAANPGDDVNPVFSPDGRWIAYGYTRRTDGWPELTRLALLERATGKTSVLTDGFDLGVQGWSWTADSRSLLFHAEARARTGIYRLVLGPAAVPRLLHQGGTTSGAEATPDGQVVFQESTLSQPAELMTMRLDGTQPRRLTNVNDSLVASWNLGAVKEATFAGAEGESVQMFLVYPPGFDPARKYPLVHMIHGGPVGTIGDGFSFRWNPHAFAAPGYVVAAVNFHGSSSFGQAWMESIMGAPGDKPFIDVMKATDHLISQGYVDADRMAAAGGSYGGYLVNWIAGHTDRFKALVTHSGVYSLLGQFGSDATYGRDLSYGGFPFTDLASIERSSPNRYAAAFVTPMLIVHGERDFRVPITHGLELYGVLKAKGVPARLVEYPDENHWVLKGANGRFWYGEVLGFLRRFLNPTP